MNEFDIRKNYMHVKVLNDCDNISNMISIMITEYFVHKYKGDMDYRKTVENILYDNNVYQRIDEIFSEIENDLKPWNEVLKKD